MKFTSELALFLKARYPIIYINTIEEDRVEYVIRKNVKTNLNRSIYSWDFVDGYTNNPNNQGFAKRNPLQALELVERLNAETPALFLLKDFNRFLTDLSISRKLRNISRILKLQPKTIIIIGSDLTIPKELQDLITVLEFRLPLEDEINQELTRLINSLKIKVDLELFENLTRACQGLSLERIRRVLSKIIATYKTIDNNSIAVLLSEKKQIISQTEILEYCSVNEKIDNLGGLNNLKDWLKKRKTAFSIQASNYGLPTPRGLLLIGIQGTGKSLTAKAIANDWQLPLLKLDVGKLFGGIVGYSIPLSVQKKQMLLTEIQSRMVNNQLLLGLVAQGNTDKARFVTSKGIVLQKKAENIQSTIAITKARAQNVAEMVLTETRIVGAGAAATAGAGYLGPLALGVGAAVITGLLAYLGTSSISGGGGSIPTPTVSEIPTEKIDPANTTAENMRTNESRRLVVPTSEEVKKYYVVVVDPLTGNKMERQVTKEYYESQGGALNER